MLAILMLKIKSSHCLRDRHDRLLRLRYLSCNISHVDSPVFGPPYVCKMNAQTLSFVSTDGQCKQHQACYISGHFRLTIPAARGRFGVTLPVLRNGMLPI